MILLRVVGHQFSPAIRQTLEAGRFVLQILLSIVRGECRFTGIWRVQLDDDHVVPIPEPDVSNLRNIQDFDLVVARSIKPVVVL